ASRPGLVLAAPVSSRGRTSTRRDVRPGPEAGASPGGPRPTPPGPVPGPARPARGQVPGRTRPDSYAVTTAWTRSRAPSLASTRPTWVLTVASATNSSVAISVLERPRAMSTSTSRSRSVRLSSTAGGVRSASGSTLARCPMSRLVEDRSEEHTSELQSRENLVCRLLLEKKKKEINEGKILQNKD